MCAALTTSAQHAVVIQYFDALAARHERLPYRGAPSESASDESWAGEALAA
jgi:hypothetical protein